MVHLVELHAQEGREVLLLRGVRVLIDPGVHRVDVGLYGHDMILWVTLRVYLRIEDLYEVGGGQGTLSSNAVKKYGHIGLIFLGVHLRGDPI